MTYKDELTIKLQQFGIEPTDAILRFIDLETIPLKAKIFNLTSALSKAEDKGDNGWISVEDRLPEYGKFILVIGTDDKQYGIERCHVCEMNDLEDGIEFKQTRQFYWLTESGRKIDKVTHWQQLPKKP